MADGKTDRILKVVLELKDEVADLRDRVDASEKRVTDRILATEDHLYGELRKMQEEQSILVGYRDMIANLEDRVERLEKHTGVAQGR